MRKLKKPIECYFVYGYVDEYLGLDPTLQPDFCFETKSIKKVCDFVKSINFNAIQIEIVRCFADGSYSNIDVDKLRSLLKEMV